MPNWYFGSATRRLTYVEFDEFEAAAHEAVEVLEDMYEQRDAETERWFQKWIDAHSRAVAAEKDVRYVEAQRDDYAARLKASNGESIRANRAESEVTELREALRLSVKYPATWGRDSYTADFYLGWAKKLLNLTRQ